MLLFSISFSSCDSFLDVRPKSEKLAGDLFKNAQGYEDAIYGVYGSLQSTNLYGQYMLWGATEVMCQHLRCYYNTILQPLSELDYTNTYVKQVFSNIWTSAYQTIGYANNILEQLKDKSEKDLPLYNYYKGEMLGVRAYLHFDMLRLFASATPTETGIPYVTSYSYSVKPFMKVSEDYDAIIADLKEAEKLLAGDETLIKYPHDNTQYEAFLNYRETHFNLYAVQALLARVYWTKGDMDNAAIYAQKVINSNKFPLVGKTEIQGYLAGTLSPKETIFGVYSTSYITTSNKLLYTYQSYVSYNPYDKVSGGNYLCTYNDIYAVDNDNTAADFRMTHFLTSGGITKFLKLVDYYTLENSARSGLMSGVTLMHTSEMYLIAAEALLESNYTQAIKYFDTELQSRGLNGFAERNLTLTKDNIFNEYRKELFGEGQVWFNMKRLNKDLTSNSLNRVIPASDKVYVVPIPDEEYEYRQ